MTVSLAQDSARAKGSESRVIDRTFRCTPASGVASLVASPRGTRELDGRQFVSSGYVRLTSGISADPLADLVAVAHRGHRNPTTHFPAAVYASLKRCSDVRSVVPLTSAGLPGPAVAFRKEAECVARQRMLVRVRAVLGAPARWGPLGGAFRGTYAGAGRRVVEANLVVRDARTRQPLAFATLSRSGRTQLWTSTRCS
jgi:hypothetical protein